MARRSPRTIYPISHERDYAARLKRRLRQAAEEIGKRVKEYDERRGDSDATDERAIHRIVERVQFAYESEHDPQEHKEIAEEVYDRADKYVDRQVKRQVKEVLGVDPMPTRRRRRQAQQFVRENVALIESLDEEFFARLESDIVLALRDGARFEQLAEVIQDRYRMSANRAELIARDQMGSLNAKLNQQKQQDVGVTHYIWRNSQDERVVGNPGGKYPEPSDPSVHGDHWAREGEKFSWSNAPEDGHPGESIACRCTAEPVWDFEDEEVDQDEEASSALESASAAMAIGGGDPPKRKVEPGAGTPEDFYREVQTTKRIEPQQRKYSCGVACVRQVLEDNGISLTEKELREQINYAALARSLKGVPPRELGEILQEHGLDAQAGTITPESADTLLEDGSAPFIALVENHWVIVDSVEDGIVRTRDPWGESGPGSSHGLEGELTVERFRQAWDDGKLGIVIW